MCEHLGRPVGRMWVVNGLQQAHTLTMTFEGAPEDGGEVSLVHTPWSTGAHQCDRDGVRLIGYSGLSAAWRCRSAG